MRKALGHSFVLAVGISTFPQSVDAPCGRLDCCLEFNLFILDLSLTCVVLGHDHCYLWLLTWINVDHRSVPCCGMEDCFFQVAGQMLPIWDGSVVLLRRDRNMDLMDYQRASLWLPSDGVDLIVFELWYRRIGGEAVFELGILQDLPVLLFQFWKLGEWLGRLLDELLRVNPGFQVNHCTLVWAQGFF